MSEPRLENWAVIHVGSRANGFSKLIGSVYGHPNHRDGEAIYTSRIVSLDIKARLCTTKNRTYRLGQPSAEYAKQYPQAVEEITCQS